VARSLEGYDWIAAGFEQAPDFTEKPWHAFYWHVWHSLRYDRPYAGADGAEYPIYWTAIDRYATRYGIDGEDFDRLVRFVSEIDTAFINMRRSQASTGPKENTDG
jgi:hypothetical protein